MDMIQSANSGHPGTPMGIAPVGYALWNDVLRFDPTDPPWPNRDRFVLSVGHASTLLWSLLHLAEVRAVDEDYACDIRDASHCDLQHAPAPDLFRNAAVRKRSITDAIERQRKHWRFSGPKLVIYCSHRLRSFTVHSRCGCGPRHPPHEGRGELQGRVRALPDPS
jgi:hypothetical protein